MTGTDSFGGGLNPEKSSSECTHDVRSHRIVNRRREEMPAGVHRIVSWRHAEVKSGAWRNANSNCGKMRMGAHGNADRKRCDV